MNLLFSYHISSFVKSIRSQASHWDVRCCKSSFLIFSIVLSRLYSITRFFLKYLTCRHMSQCSQYKLIGDTEYHTQAFAQAPSNSSSSFPHFPRAFLSSLTASKISFLSRQVKNRSRPSQHRSREDRSGAMRPPSEDLGASSEDEDEDDQGSQPILVFGSWWGFASVLDWLKSNGLNCVCWLVDLYLYAR